MKGHHYFLLMCSLVFSANVFAMQLPAPASTAASTVQQDEETEETEETEPDKPATTATTAELDDASMSTTHSKNESSVKLLTCPPSEIVEEKMRVKKFDDNKFAMWYFAYQGVYYSGRKPVKGRYHDVGVGKLRTVGLSGQAVNCNYDKISLTNFGDLDEDSYFASHNTNKCETKQFITCIVTDNNPKSCSFVFCK